MKAITDFARNNRLLTVALAIILVLASSMGAARAYFTTYVQANGGYVIQMNDEIVLEEEFKDNVKTISLKNTGETPVYGRVTILHTDQQELDVTKSEKWSLSDDGFWYYEDVIYPGESSDELVAAITVKAEDEGSVKPDSFDVIVASECTRYIEYADNNANGPKYPGWTQGVEK